MTLDDILQKIHTLEDELRAYECKYSVLSETVYELFANDKKLLDSAWEQDWTAWVNTYKVWLRLRDQVRSAAQSQSQSKEETWGAKLNTSNTYKPRDRPAWANPFQREKWEERGIVLWDHEIHQVTRLWAAQALQVLAYLHANDDWKTKGVEIGEPATQIMLDDPEHKPTQVLTDKMMLTPDRVCELLTLLECNEQVLQKMQQEDQKEFGRRLARAYALILKWPATQKD